MNDHLETPTEQQGGGSSRRAHPYAYRPPLDTGEGGEDVVKGAATPGYGPSGPNDCGVGSLRPLSNNSSWAAE